MNTLLLWALGASLMCITSVHATSPPVSGQHTSAAGASTPVPIDLADCIRPLGYEGLDPAIRERDVHRVLTALRAPASPADWPTREVAQATDLKGFPESVRTESLREPVPIYVIVDPSAIDDAWGHEEADPKISMKYPPFDAHYAESIVALFPQTAFPSGAPLPLWPSWGDTAWNMERSPAYDGMDERTWGSITTNALGWNNFVRAQLQRAGVTPHAVTYVARISSGVWRVLPLQDWTNVPKRGTLVFPLWESTGLLRPDDGTARTTPPERDSPNDGPRSGYPRSTRLRACCPNSN